MGDKGRWCAQCAGIKPCGLEACKEIAYSKGGVYLSPEYKNINGLMQWECNKGHKWFASFNGLELDIYYPQYGFAIEVQGKQHEQYIKHFHKNEEDFKKQLMRDQIKRELCDENWFVLIEIWYYEDPHILTSEIEKNCVIVSLPFLEAHNNAHKKKNAFAKIDSNELRLWKVDIPIGIKNKNTKIFAENINNYKGVELLPNATIETVFHKESENTKFFNIRIIAQPPVTAGTSGSLSTPMKRPDESQFYNREHVTSHEEEFWNELSDAYIVLKLPDSIDKTMFVSGPLSEYISVKGNEIVLSNCVMLNAQNELILNNGEPVMGELTKIKMNFVKFPRLRKSPYGIVYGISTQDILIKESYLQMIEKIEYDRTLHEKRGCIIIGSPGIGKTHFSLYLAFYLVRRYSPADIIYEQLFQGYSRALHVKPNISVMKILDLTRELPQDSFYIADFVIPAPWKMIFTFLVTTPKSGRWHEFVKGRVRKYYAPIWTEEEIWTVWNVKYKNEIPESRVKELITRWGCIPRRVFDEYDDEPKVDDVVSQCDAYVYLKNGGGNLGDNYSEKAIHIIPNSDFTDKIYVPASTEICEALSAGGTLAGKFFEMVAHDILRKGGDFTVRRLTRDSIKQPEEELHLQNLPHQQFHNIDEIVPGYYNIPENTNFESVDAIAPNRNGIHHLYQMTIAETHDIKVNGLNKLENNLKDLPIHLYFVVPNINEMFDNFRFQKYVTSGNRIFRMAFNTY
ncbi:5075_t:CDS:2 [Cetraspora pellucida]|uniref:5075_t:CDS:1 n=1 Tax=Cetraspora pellucida TaxID=1433469 RepID=A0A9N8ZS47_9GLOM|nr:5075_t:CDS:2 [Cetraspora pellucida]